MPAGLAIRPLADFGAQAWRNGGGTTRALADHADGGWRISLADVVRDGPYSCFDGMARCSLIVSGRGVTLRHGAHRIELRHGEPAVYEGGVTWHASLHDGPVASLNTMAAHGRFVARIVPLTDAQSGHTKIASRAFALVLTLSGRCAWETADGSGPGAHGTLDPAQVLTRDANGPPLHVAAAHGKGLCAALVMIEPACAD